MKRFVLIGAAGYIAPRHMKAIRETGNTLVAALDPNDSVGMIDSYFPESAFFTEFERFDRHVSRLKRHGVPIDYVSRLFAQLPARRPHSLWACAVGANVICEKPLVLNPWNVEGLRDIEGETGRRVYTILQLRLAPCR
jgi:UDP-N-acetyl-2-amino-2-deoxyglucuronate dehydrogenase